VKSIVPFNARAGWFRRTSSGGRNPTNQLGQNLGRSRLPANRGPEQITRNNYLQRFPGKTIRIAPVWRMKQVGPHITKRRKSGRVRRYRGKRDQRPKWASKEYRSVWSLNDTKKKEDCGFKKGPWRPWPMYGAVPDLSNRARKKTSQQLKGRQRNRPYIQTLGAEKTSGRRKRGCSPIPDEAAFSNSNTECFCEAVGTVVCSRTAFYRARRKPNWTQAGRLINRHAQDFFLREWFCRPFVDTLKGAKIRKDPEQPGSKSRPAPLPVSCPASRTHNV